MVSLWRGILFEAVARVSLWVSSVKQNRKRTKNGRRRSLYDWSLASLALWCCLNLWFQEWRRWYRVYSDCSIIRYFVTQQVVCIQVSIFPHPEEVPFVAKSPDRFRPRYPPERSLFFSNGYEAEPGHSDFLAFSRRTEVLKREFSHTHFAGVAVFFYALFAGLLFGVSWFLFINSEIRRFHLAQAGFHFSRVFEAMGWRFIFFLA